MDACPSRCIALSEADKGTTGADLRVARLAAQRNGVLSTRQLNACGLDCDAIAVRVARGQLHRVYRGVYVVGHEAITRTARFAAAVLACGEGAALSHYSAGAHLGAVAWDDRTPEVNVPRNGGRRIDAIRVHRGRLDPRDVWVRDGVRVTSPARTLLDLAATLSPTALRRTVRQAQAEQLVNVRQLLEILGRHRGHRGAAKLRTAIVDGPVPTRSAHEDQVLDLITQAGLERPALNPRLRLDGRVIVPDLLWREQRLIVECDSRRWHGDPLTRQEDADKQAILEAHGYRVLRITWQQAVDHPRQTIARVRAALADGR